MHYYVRLLLTKPIVYGTIKIMKRDFWRWIRHLGHMPLLVSHEELIMSKVSLVADGWKNKDTRVVLWAIGGEGGYAYELEEGCRTSLMNCSYEYAIEKVKRLCSETNAVCVY